jgi:hypothetical protein
MMRLPLSHLGIALLAGGLSGALIVNLFGPVPPSAQHPQFGDSGATSAELAERFDELEKDNAALRASMRALESIPSSSGSATQRAPEDGYLSQANLDALRNEMLAKLPSLGSLPDQDPAELQERVKLAIEAIQEQEEAEKGREEIARTTAGFSDWLELSESQQVQFQTVWEQRALRESEIRALEKSGTVSRDEITARRQTLNATVRDDVASFLDQEQLRVLMTKFGTKQERAAAKKGG